MSLSADIHIVSRGCAPTKSEEKRYETGCHPAEEFKDQIDGTFNQPGAPSLGDLKGTFCVCEGDGCNGAAGNFPVVLLVLTLVSLAYVL